MDISGESTYCLKLGLFKPRCTSYPADAYSGGKLLWSYGQSLDATYKRFSGVYTQLDDNFGTSNLWGQCVSAVKALAKSNVPTSQWKKGDQVVNGGVSSGTVCATFSGSGGTFISGSDHVVIFKAPISNGIEVWDQNWYPLVVGKHTISRSGSGVVNANNYYTVLV